jgi:hypothetical protein
VLPEEAREFLFSIRIYPDEAEEYFVILVRLLYLQFKKTPLYHSLGKLYKQERLTFLATQQQRKRAASCLPNASNSSATSATSASTSTATTATRDSAAAAISSASSSVAHSTSSPSRKTPQEIMDQVQQQYLDTADAQQANGSLRRSHRLSSDDIILKSPSGRSSANSSAIEELVAAVITPGGVVSQQQQVLQQQQQSQLPQHLQQFSQSRSSSGSESPDIRAIDQTRCVIVYVRQTYSERERECVCVCVCVFDMFG